MYKIASAQFDIKKIADSGQIFRLYEIEEGLFKLVAKGQLLMIQKIDDGIYDIDCDRNAYESIWRDYFDLDTDYAQYEKHIPKEDIFLNQALEYARGIRILRQEAWEMLISFIISQRKSIPAIQSSIEKLARMFGEKIEEDTYAFPSAKNLARASLDELNACSLGYRSPYILDTARRVADGDIDLKKMETLDDENLRRTLMACKGVGIKVANCVALFGYHRISAFPIDVWIERMIDTYYKGVFPLERYQEYAGVIQQYIFFYGRQSSRLKNTFDPNI